LKSDLSLPTEWINVLRSFEGDKADMLWNLKHKYTVSDVYDMLEYSNVEYIYNSERARIERQQQK